MSTVVVGVLVVCSGAPAHRSAQSGHGRIARRVSDGLRFVTASRCFRVMADIAGLAG